MSILIIFVVIIVLLQVFLFLKTGRLITKLKQTLSGSFSTATAMAENVMIIKYQAPKIDQISGNIEQSINTYLRKNKGAVSDFNLIKDIVERNCDTLESEITSQTPLPLYLGLMGTVLGIVLGLFTIYLNGGFSNIEKVIEILMGDVAVAMIASFMGILFTTWTLWRSKDCKVTVEENKNRFYSWIQTTLLPVLSKSAVSAITLLQQNLTRFNESFGTTADRLEEKLQAVGDVYESQIEVLDKIESIDVKKMATANVKILAALDSSMGNLNQFAQYMSSMTEYLSAVRDLNIKLDDHLERTEALGVVAEFYKKQMNEIELRQEAIKTAVIAVDDVMRSALASLRSNSEEGIRALQETFTDQMLAIRDIISHETERMAAQANQMPKLIEKLNEVSKLPEKLDKLIDKIDKSNTSLANKLSQNVRTSVPALANSAEEVPQSFNSGFGITPWMKWLGVGAIVIVVLTCIANLTVNIISLQTDKTYLETLAPVTDEIDVIETDSVIDNAEELNHTSIPIQAAEDTIQSIPADSLSPIITANNKANNNK